MAVVQRLLADTKGEWFVTPGGLYLALPGQSVEATPVGAPANLRYDDRTRTLSWDAARNADKYVVLEARQERTARVKVATVLGTQYQLPNAVGPDEHASWRVSAVDDYTGLASSPSRPVFFAGMNKK